jgi:aspartyl/asparaginyl beta-hydroxylase (cupin superfamily)
MNQTALPADAASLNNQGMQALRAESFAMAEKLFVQAAELDPAASALWRNVATARRAQANDAGELQALNAAIDADRRDFMAWLRKAELHQRKGDDALSLSAWNAVIQLAAQADSLPPELAAVVDGGREFVTRATARVADAVEKEIASLAPDFDETERRRSRAFVDLALGRRIPYVNHCEGLYYPFLPADEFFDRRHFPWMPDVESATDKIRKELKALLDDPGEALRPYVRMDKGLPDNKWSPLDHSLDWSACFLWEYGQPNQAVLDRCPATAAALAGLPYARIPDRAPSAFFSILQPRTRIPAHTGVTNTRSIVHLPLIVPAGCGFRVGGETREWKEGQAFVFDDTIEHEAWNESDEMRAVLIFDVWNPHLSVREQKLVARYFTAADQTGLNPARE